MNAAFKKWGNSQGIIIPKSILEIVGITENEPVNLSVENGNIVISRIEKTKKTIEEIFEGYTGDFQNEEIDWGDDVGEEVWW
jgi:Growth regulator